MNGGMLELVDKADLESAAVKGMRVRVSLSPQLGSSDGIGRHEGLKIPCFMRLGSNPRGSTILKRLIL